MRYFIFDVFTDTSPDIHLELLRRKEPWVPA